MNTKFRNSPIISRVVRLAAFIAALVLVAITLLGLGTAVESNYSRGERATTVLPAMNIIVVTATRLLPQIPTGRTNKSI